MKPQWMYRISSLFNFVMHHTLNWEFKDFLGNDRKGMTLKGRERVQIKMSWPSFNYVQIIMMQKLKVPGVIQASAPLTSLYEQFALLCLWIVLLCLIWKGLRDSLCDYSSWHQQDYIRYIIIYGKLLFPDHVMRLQIFCNMQPLKFFFLGCPRQEMTQVNKLREQHNAHRLTLSVPAD